MSARGVGRHAEAAQAMGLRPVKNHSSQRKYATLRCAHPFIEQQRRWGMSATAWIVLGVAVVLLVWAVAVALALTLG